MVKVVGGGARDGDTWCAKRDVACIESPGKGNPSLRRPKATRYDSVKVLVCSSSSPLQFYWVALTGGYGISLFPQILF
jgi:hypothetical protein